MSICKKCRNKKVLIITQEIAKEKINSVINDDDVLEKCKNVIFKYGPFCKACDQEKFLQSLRFAKKVIE